MEVLFFWGGGFTVGGGAESALFSSGMVEFDKKSHGNTEFTLGVQTFASRNFRDFREFWSNSRKSIPRKILKLLIRESLFSRKNKNHTNFVSALQFFPDHFLEVIFMQFYLFGGKET